VAVTSTPASSAHAPRPAAVRPAQSVLVVEIWKNIEVEIEREICGSPFRADVPSRFF
jgi:hypothetical protein